VTSTWCRTPNMAMQTNREVPSVKLTPRTNNLGVINMPKPGPRTTYKYTDQFKATAVKLSKLPGVASKDVAESL